MLKLFSISFTTQVVSFVVFIVGKFMMTEYLHFDDLYAGVFNLIAIVSYAISTLIFGYLSNKIDKRYLILFGVVGLLLSSYPVIWSLKCGNL
jgi:MFS family permease